MAVTIPKATLKIMTELTGEPIFERALPITLKDSIEHRLERINQELEIYQKKYRMDFTKFNALWAKEEVTNQSSYEVEKDFLEWDGLIMRKDKLEELAKWII